MGGLFLNPNRPSSTAQDGAHCDAPPGCNAFNGQNGHRVGGSEPHNRRYEAGGRTMRPAMHASQLRVNSCRHSRWSDASSVIRVT